MPTVLLDGEKLNIQQIKEKYPETSALSDKEIVNTLAKRLPEVSRKDIESSLEYERPANLLTGVKALYTETVDKLAPNLAGAIGTIADMGLNQKLGVMQDPITKIVKEVNPKAYDFKLGESLKQWSKEYKPLFNISDKEKESFWLYTVPSAFGSTARFAVEALVFKGASLPVMGADIFGETYRDISIEHPEWDDKKRIGYSAMQAVPQALLERWGTNIILDPFLNTGKRSIKDLVLKGSLYKGFANNVAKTYVTEAVQEGSQQMASNVVDKLYKLDRGLFDGVLESALVGGIVGGTVGGAGSIFQAQPVKQFQTELEARGFTQGEIKELNRVFSKQMNQEIELNPEGFTEALGVLNKMKEANTLDGQARQKAMDRLKSQGMKEADAIDVVSNINNMDILNLQDELFELENEETIAEYNELKNLRALDIASVSNITIEQAEKALNLNEAVIKAHALVQGKTMADILRTYKFVKGEEYNDTIDNMVKNVNEKVDVDITDAVMRFTRQETERQSNTLGYWIGKTVEYEGVTGRLKVDEEGNIGVDTKNRFYELNTKDQDAEITDYGIKVKEVPFKLSRYGEDISIAGTMYKIKEFSNGNMIVIGENGKEKTFKNKGFVLDVEIARAKMETREQYESSKNKEVLNETFKGIRTEKLRQEYPDEAELLNLIIAKSYDEQTENVLKAVEENKEVSDKNLLIAIDKINDSIMLLNKRKYKSEGAKNLNKILLNQMEVLKNEYSKQGRFSTVIKAGSTGSFKEFSDSVKEYVRSIQEKEVEAEIARYLPTEESRLRAEQSQSNPIQMVKDMFLGEVKATVNKDGKRIKKFHKKAIYVPEADMADWKLVKQKFGIMEFTTDKNKGVGLETIASEFGDFYQGMPMTEQELFALLDSTDRPTNRQELREQAEKNIKDSIEEQKTKTAEYIANQDKLKEEWFESLQSKSWAEWVYEASVDEVVEEIEKYGIDVTDQYLLSVLEEAEKVVGKEKTKGKKGMVGRAFGLPIILENDTYYADYYGEKIVGETPMEVKSKLGKLIMPEVEQRTNELFQREIENIRELQKQEKELKQEATDPLIAEARKYKSAEWFVKSQTNGYVTVYHRSKTPIIGDYVGKENTGSMFVSNRKDGQAIGYGDNVIELRVKEKDLEIDDEFTSGEEHYQLSGKKANEYLKQQQQLTDIWNKSQELKQDGSQLYSKRTGKTKGSFIELTDGTRLIKLFEGADIGTLVHELSHSWASMMTEKQLKPIMDMAGIKTLSTVEKRRIINGKVEFMSDYQIVQETFADAFTDNYMYEGIAPVPEAQSLFDQFKDWLVALYENIPRARMTLSPEVKEFFDGMLSDGWIAENKKNIKTTNEAIELYQKEIEEVAKKREELISKIRKGTSHKGDVRANTRELIRQVQQELVDYIDKFDFSQDEKGIFISNLKRTLSEKQLIKEIKNVEIKATKRLEARLRNNYKSLIEKEVARKFMAKVGQQNKGKYDYETNMFFKNIRDYSRLNKADAEKLLDSMNTNEATDNLARTERAFLFYKAYPEQASIEILKDLLENLKFIRAEGIASKSEADFLVRANRNKIVEEVVTSMKENKLARNALTRFLTSEYAKWFGNIRTFINATVGKDIADRLNPEYQESLRETGINTKENMMKEKTKEIYGLKTDFEYGKKMVELSKEEYEIKDTNNVPEKLSIMKIMHIYLNVQNTKTRKRYNAYFADNQTAVYDELDIELPKQIVDVLNLLTEEDLAFADMLQETVQSYYKDFNAVHIRTHGIDLGMPENYFPNTSETEQELYDDIRRKGETVSAENDRAGFTKPIPSNAYRIADKYIRDAEHKINLSETYVELKKMINSNHAVKLDDNTSTTFKRYMTELYGDFAFKTLENLVDSISLNQNIQVTSSFEKIHGKLLTNWTIAKIASPMVGMKQITATNNYMENMPADQWLGGLTKTLANPKGTIDYMFNHPLVGEFLKERFHVGNNEALIQILKEADYKGLLSSKWTRLMTLSTRTGDIVSIIFGGKPYLDYLENNYTPEEAKKMFIDQTLATMQSGQQSSTSVLQQKAKGSPLIRAYTVFFNTNMQYTRKWVDASYELYRGEITPQHYMKLTVNYLMIQPALFTTLGMLSKAMVYGDDLEEMDWAGELLISMMLAPFSGIPLVIDVMRAGARKVTGKKVWEIFNTGMLGDIEDMFRPLLKNEWTVEDMYKQLAIGAEITTKAPATWVKRTVEKNMVRFEE